MDAFLNYLGRPKKLMTMEVNALNPHVSVDCVIFGYDFEELKVLLIERNYFDANDHQQNKKITDYLLYYFTLKINRKSFKCPTKR